MPKTRKRKMSVSHRAKILSGGRSRISRSRHGRTGSNRNDLVYTLPHIPHQRTKKVRAFTKKDFRSGDGMLTTVWGPSMWHFLHTMSFNYPVSPTPEQKQHYMDFILNLRNILPCKYCRQNIVKNFKIFRYNNEKNNKRRGE